MSTNDDDGQKRTARGRFRSLNLTPKRISASVDSTRLADEDFHDRILFLELSAGGVTLAVEGAGDTGTGGALAELDAEQARLLADALHQAADEIDGGDA